MARRAVSPSAGDTFLADARDEQRRRVLVLSDDTAQQRGLPGATRQMSPSFFMQKPIAFRHWKDWL